MTNNLLVVHGIPLTRKVYNYINDVMQEDYENYFNTLYNGCDDIPSGFIGTVLTTLSRGDMIGKLGADKNNILCITPNIEDGKEYSILVTQKMTNKIINKIKDFPIELQNLLKKPVIYLIWEDV